MDNTLSNESDYLEDLILGMIEDSLKINDVNRIKEICKHHDLKFFEEFLSGVPVECNLNQE